MAMNDNRLYGSYTLKKFYEGHMDCLGLYH